MKLLTNNLKCHAVLAMNSKYPPVLFCYCLFLFLSSGCAASFTYVPLSEKPGSLEFLHVRAHREYDTVVVNGDLGNNLGFPVNDIVVMATGFNKRNDAASRTSLDLYGKLDANHARSFELVFQDPQKEILTFQILANTYLRASDIQSGSSQGFTKTIGIGSQALNTASAISNATSGFASQLPIASGAMNLAGQAASFGQPPNSSGESSSEPSLIQAQSPLYPVPE